MKFFVVFVVICAIFISSSYSLKNAICGETPKQDGNGVVKCTGYFPSWSYIPAQNQCEPFLYGGCGGNNNRFGAQSECEAMCKE